MNGVAEQEGRQIGGAGEMFAVGRAEGEEHREAAFAEAGMFFHREALLQLHLRFRRLVQVGDFHGAAVGPWDRERHQLIQPTNLPGCQMLMERGDERRGLGLLHQ